MDCIRSLGTFAWGVIWRGIVFTLLLAVDAFDLLETVFGVRPMVAQWMTWSLFGIGIFLAIFLTFNKQYIQARKLESRLKEKATASERELRRQRLIEQREPDLTEMLQVLPKMRRQLNALVNAAETEAIDCAELQRLDSELLPLAKTLRGKNEEKFLQIVAWAIEAYGFGLGRLKKTDSTWLVLQERIQELRTTVGDSTLNSRVERYLKLLDGVCSINLFSFYTSQCSTQTTTREQFGHLIATSSREEMVNLALVDVSKRIEELRAGDEAK